MSPILVCTDGQTHAKSALRHAAWAAERLGVGIEVLHVLDHHRERAAGLDLTGAIGIDASAQVTEALTQLEETEGRQQRVKGKAILDEARQLLEGFGVTNAVYSQRHGSLVETVEEIGSRYELVVLGERGESGNSLRGNIGSQVEQVIRSTIRPVLLVERKFRPIERFLLAYDGGPSVTRAMDFLVGHGLLTGCACHLVGAGRIDDDAKWFLGEAAARMAAAGYQVTHEAISGRPEEVLPAAIERTDSQLVVMGAYGHSPIRRLLLGSTTTIMIRSSRVPLLLFR